MILDSGICSIFAVEDRSAPGEMPKPHYQLVTMCYFGWLDFATAEMWATEDREETEVSARIRILQDRDVSNKNTVVLRETYEIEPGDELYEITRAYHGHDDESGMRITDLTLRRVSP